MKFKILFIFLFLNNVVQADIFSNYFAKKAYSNKDFKKVIQLLEKEQVEKPNDSIINYNLGTAYYNLNDFSKAKQNFQRSVENVIEKQLELKEMAYFNWGNSFYYLGLNLLGTDWDNKKISDDVLGSAIVEVKSAIEKYKNSLVLNKNNNKALVNKKNAEEILKKLEEKRKENKQDQNQEQENSEQHDSQNNERSKDNKKSDSNQNQNLSQEKQKNDQSQDSKQEDKGQNGSQDSQKDGEKGEDKKLDGEQAEQEKNDVNKREQGSSFEQNDKQNSEQASSQKDKQSSQKNQESSLDEQNVGAAMQGQMGFQEKDDIKSKMLRATLDDLQNDEAELQKILIKHKTKGGNPNLDKGQRPW
ncbi:MAG: hypothetical protein ABIF12_01215 [bacterium]